MYHRTSGRFDLQNITQEEAHAMSPNPPDRDYGFGPDIYLARVEILTPTGRHVIGCSSNSTFGDVKRLLLEQVQFYI